MHEKKTNRVQLEVYHFGLTPSHAKDQSSKVKTNKVAQNSFQHLDFDGSL